MSNRFSSTVGSLGIDLPLRNQNPSHRRPSCDWIPIVIFVLVGVLVPEQDRLLLDRQATSRFDQGVGLPLHHSSRHPFPC